MTADAASPTVSVIMANYDAGAHVGAAVRSVLEQTETSLELILADDGSTDASLEEARAAADGDPRLVVVEGGGRTGPAATRNRALARARGRWVAIVDSDDVIHSERLGALIAAGERDRADIVADDLLVFYDGGAAKPHAFLTGRLAAGPTALSAADYVAANRLVGRSPSLGYLKPVIRRDRIPADAYDERLTIGEDYDLIFRLLRDGARMRVYPTLGYFYRKHAASISHRLGDDAAERIRDAHERQAESCAHDPALAAVMARRGASIDTARAFSTLVDDLKARRFGAAFAAAARRPSAAWLLHQPVAHRLQRALSGGGKAAAVARPPHVTALIDDLDGGAALERALRQAGIDADLIRIDPASADQRAEALRVAREARRDARAIVCTSEAAARSAPYALAPSAPVLIAAHGPETDAPPLTLARDGRARSWSWLAELAGARATAPRGAETRTTAAIASTPAADRTGAAIIIAAYNAQATIARAVDSALAQDGVSEVCVVDDASSDATAAIARARPDQGKRLTVLVQEANAGPSAARNRAIDSTTAPWLGVLDADDYLFPGRIARQLAHAEKADFIADTLIRTPYDAPTPPTGAAADRPTPTPGELDLERFVRGNRGEEGDDDGGLDLGFLKPLMRRSFLDAHGLRYRPEMRLGEDYELYARALALRARFLTAPAYGYVSIVRPGSLSHKHSAGDLRRLRDCDDALAALPGLSPAERSAIARHRAGVDCRLQWRLLINAVKARDPIAAAATFHTPRSALYLAARLGEQAWLRGLSLVGLRRRNAAEAEPPEHGGNARRI